MQSQGIGIRSSLEEMLFRLVKYYTVLSAIYDPVLRYRPMPNYENRYSDLLYVSFMKRALMAIWI